MIEIKWHPSCRQLRQFSLLAGVFFTLLAGWLAWRHHATVLPLCLLALAVAVGVIGLLRPSWIRWFYVTWMVLVFPVGWLVSHLLLAIVFYLVITPTGLVLRLFGYDPMQRKREPQAETYWTPRTPPDDHRSYFKQY